MGVDPAPLLRKTGLDQTAAGAPSTSRPQPLLDLTGLSNEDLGMVAAFVAGLRAR